MVNIKDLTITELETITAFAIGSGNYLFTLDELQNSNLRQTQDKQDITGKGGRKISSLKRNKAVTVGATNGLVSGGLLSMQTGSEFENKAIEVKWVDYLTVQSHAASTSYKAVGTTGAEINALYIRNADGSLGEKLEQNSTAAAGKFTYTPTTKALSFHTDVADGTEIVVYYSRKIVADTLANDSNTYSGKCQMYIDAFAEDKCANVYRVQIYIPKADFSGEFELAFGENQAVHSFEAEALSGACGAGGNFFTFTVFGTDTPDA